MNSDDLARLIDARRSDQTDTLLYGSYVSQERRYFYVPVGRAASTKIRLTLEQLGNCNAPASGLVPGARVRPEPGSPRSLADFSTPECISILTSPEWFRFCFVRNPYYRLFSAYKSKMLRHLNPEYEWVRNEIRTRCRYPVRNCRPAGMVAFRDFVRYVQVTLNVSRDPHWDPQTKLLAMDAIAYDFVGRVEDFPRDFAHVLHRLGAPRALVDAAPDRVYETLGIYLAAAYDRSLAAVVHDLYKADFETLSYDPDSWLFDYL